LSNVSLLRRLRIVRRPLDCPIAWAATWGVATAFLAHDAARLTTGETLYIDGGGLVARFSQIEGSCVSLIRALADIKGFFDSIVWELLLKAVPPS
jgi:hypothetical protein